MRETQSMSEYFDEMFNGDGSLRGPYEEIGRWFDAEDVSRLRAKQREAEEVFRLTGITFNVYGKAEAEERLLEQQRNEAEYKMLASRQYGTIVPPLEF